MSQTGKILISFILLFFLYHLAEYFILFKNNPAIFLIIQGLFFAAAFVLGHWYSGNGWATWGLSWNGPKNVGIGVAIGVFIYAVPYVLGIALGIEKVAEVPALTNILKQVAPFAFGVCFSSFSEDILTRGLLFTFLNGKMKPWVLVLVSALVYVLNHIYRLGHGLEAVLYLFLLGILFCIPRVASKNLWATGFIHWSGNTFFFVSHNVIKTESVNPPISANYFFTLCLCFLIPFVWWISDSKLMRKESD